MKNMIIALSGIWFVAVVSSASAVEFKKNQQQTQQIAQYQIVPVEYNSSNTGSNTVNKAVLMIEVLTGKTWILKDDVLKTEDGKLIFSRGWEELERYLELKDPRK